MEINDPLNATKITLLEYSDLRKRQPKKFYVQGNTDCGWRSGVGVEWMHAFVRVKNETSEFIVPAANLCRLHKEDLDILNKS